MKFNKTLTFNSGERRTSHDNQIENGAKNFVPPNGRRRSSSSKLEKERQTIKNNQQLNCSGQQSLDPNDDNGLNNGHYDHDSALRPQYCDESHWPNQKREKVKRFRFVICLLALLGLALGLMSRLMLNVSIVEMVELPDMVVPGENPVESPSQTVDPLLFAATFDEQDSTPVTAEYQSGPPAIPDQDMASVESDTQQQQQQEGEKEELGDGLRFKWSKQDVNMILGSLYLGYMPGILLSGDIAQRYGAKYPLLLCIFGTAVINLLTPTIARFSLNLLIASRILLGLIQGSLLPALYELFNRWLTPTESSIFAPMIKVSMPLGSLIGTLMPGILASYKLEWPNLFYIGGLLCLIWSCVWLFVATSMPQTNRFIEQNEINRIMRKKGSVAKINIGGTSMAAKQTAGDVKRRLSSADIEMSSQKQKQQQQQQQQSSLSAPDKPKKATPWLQIITNPSVLALTLVKFTYNIGMDFIFLQLAVYLREVHSAPIETISAIASGGYCMQMFLISFVGWIAKIVVIKRSFGLSVTKWRKIFQSGANILMAVAYLVLAYLSPGIEVATGLVFCVAFFWMLGAGGESMVPYDLSAKYPASIVGFAHSVSIMSGIALTAICGIVLGENTADSSRWSLLFYMLSSLLAFGGIVFALVVKAKPFLPGERVPKNDDTTKILNGMANR